MRSVRSRWLLPLALAGALTLAACGGSTGVGTTQLSLSLTDAPSGDLLEAWVQIDSVWLQGSTTGSSAGHATLIDQPTGLVDLTNLDGVTQDLVKDVQVPSGTYAQLRIFVSQGVVVARNAAGDLVAYSLGGAQLPNTSSYKPTLQGTLACPSCAQSGFKVNLPGGSVKLAGTQKILVLDFDVAQSFGHDAAVSNQWILHPVMMATEFEVSGSINGKVSLDQSQVTAIPDCPTGTARSIEDFIPTATLSSDPTAVSSGTVAADSTYTIDFLTPDTYLMAYEDSVAFGASDTLVFQATPSSDQVTLASGDTATVNYTITSATCIQH